MTVRRASLLLTSLREQTRSSHERLEKDLDLLGEAMTLARYRDVLARFYGFYAPLEPELAGAADWPALGYDFEDRRKVGMLAMDLTRLGLTAEALERLPRCRRLPSVHGLASALGVLYVIEGSTLGGQLLSRHFATHLNLTPDTGCGFYTSYGSEVGARWQQFRTFLDAHTQASDGPDVVAAANETFDRLYAWLLSP